MRKRQTGLPVRLFASQPFVFADLGMRRVRGRKNATADDAILGIPRAGAIFTRNSSNCARYMNYKQPFWDDNTWKYAHLLVLKSEWLTA